MDLDADGLIDVLSGSYARLGGRRVGWFQVLWGQEDGGWSPPEALRGTDGEPLEIGEGTEGTAIRVCTRVFAADLDEDGYLDLISGNLEGSFHLHRGVGPGSFAPSSSPLLDDEGKPLQVESKSDPCLVDWDGDGDLDLLSGSGRGGVFASENAGTPGRPRFRAMATLVQWRSGIEPIRFGLDRDYPERTTRVWADDLDGDGDLDLLIGDHATILRCKAGVTPEQARTWLAGLEQEADLESIHAVRRVLGNEGTPADLLAELQAVRTEIRARRQSFLDEEETGFVWAVLQR